MLVRHATVDDMAAIQALVDWGASTGELVPCHAEELAERLDQFWVVADSDQILGVCALRPVAENLAELCSLAVWPERQRHGLGRRLVRTCLDWARQRRMHALRANVSPRLLRAVRVLPCGGATGASRRLGGLCPARENSRRKRECPSVRSQTRQRESMRFRPPGRLFYNYRDTTRAPLKRRSPAETLLSPPASIKMRCCPVGSGGGCQTSKGCADVHVSLLPERSKSE